MGVRCALPPGLRFCLSSVVGWCLGETMARYHILDAKHTDPARIKREREKARELRKTRWWLDQVNRGLCHHCGGKFKASELTMDHLIPLARGGTSAKGNIVCSCRSCNQSKKLETPVDDLFEQLERERGSRGSSEGEGDR
jgi:5-methylcytosine-specific restriction protein A